MTHLVLLGDSIFDNGVYVESEQADVTAHLRRKLEPLRWTLDMRAVDGAVAGDHAVGSDDERVHGPQTLSAGGESVTGRSDGQLVRDGHVEAVDLTAPQPRNLRLEAAGRHIDQLVAPALTERGERGSVQGQVRVRLLEIPVAELDLKVLRRYLAAWRKAEKELGLTVTDPSMAELLALPGAQHGVEESATVTRGVAKAVTEATKAALEALTESRAQEGARLAKEMLRLGKRLSSLLKKVEKHIPAAKKAVAAKLKERVAQAMCGVTWQFLAASRGLSGSAGSTCSTSTPAPAICSALRASASACWSTIGPRLVLIRKALFFMSERRWALTSVSVSGVSGQCRLTTSLALKSVSTSTNSMSSQPLSAA